MKPKTMEEHLSEMLGTEGVGVGFSEEVKRDCRVMTAVYLCTLKDSEVHSICTRYRPSGGGECLYKVSTKCLNSNFL